MDSNSDKTLQKREKRKRVLILGTVAIILLASGYWVMNYNSDQSSMSKTETAPISANQDLNRIENGIHVRTGLVEDEGLMTVVAHCTACHSAQLVMQNRMNEERWNATIRWMQETQNLWDLGENQEVIVQYLVRNYPPVDKGRRENLKDIEWYDLPE